MEPQEIHSAFERDGALVFPDFFSSDELWDVNAAIDALLAMGVSAGKRQSDGYVRQYATDVIGLGERAARHPAFIALQSHPRLREVTQAALGDFVEEYLLVQVTVNGTGQAWHQDSSDPNHFWLNRLIYVRDIAPEGGQIVLVPGSVHRGRIPAGGHQDPIAGELALAPKAGTLILMSTYCWHRVSLNTSGRPRVSVNYRVRPTDAPEDLTATANFRNGTHDFRTHSP